MLKLLEIAVFLENEDNDEVLGQKMKEAIEQVFDGQLKQYIVKKIAWREDD
jgi:hypothetical protein